MSVHSEQYGELVVREGLRKTEIGDRFGKLTVVGIPFWLGMKNGRHQCVMCECDCGNCVPIRWCYLKMRDDCGCCKKEKLAKASETHGLRKHPLYSIWNGMLSRCKYPKLSDYENYGGRGIKVCEEWINSFECFYEWAVSNGWRKGLEIDRTNNNLGYFPENCRFVTRSENVRNSRHARMVEAFGETKCMIEWSEDERCVVSYETFRGRIKSGWDSEEALLTPQLWYKKKKESS